MITIAGLVAMVVLPVAQYPEIAPPTIQVSCVYPGANAEVVAETVAAPIEQQVNGVENMLYMSSQCTNDGAYNLTVTFKLGTNLDMAQVLVQNRVSMAMPTLPDLVKQAGVTTKKKSPNIMLVVSLFSPDDSRDQLFLSNFATIRVKDELARLEGVGDVTLLGQQDYSMRVWLNPDKMARLGLTYYGFTTVPTGFIPSQDKGYLLVTAQLPDSASLQRTQEVVARMEQIALDMKGEGVKHTVAVAGQSFLLNANGSNFGSLSQARSNSP